MNQKVTIEHLLTVSEKMFVKIYLDGFLRFLLDIMK